MPFENLGLRKNIYREGIGQALQFWEPGSEATLGSHSSMNFLPTKTLHGPRNIKVTGGHLLHCTLAPSLTHLLPLMGGPGRRWVLQIPLP